MRITNRQCKKITGFVFGALLITASHVQAQEEPTDDMTFAEKTVCPKGNTIPELLTCIKQYSYYTLFQLDKLPEYIKSMLAPADDKEITDKLRQSFQNFSNANIKLDNAQNATEFQQKIANEFFGDTSPNPFLKKIPPMSPNDLAFQTLKGQLFYPEIKGVDHAYNYLLNASAMNIPHIAPQAPGISWDGGKTNIRKYELFYNSITAVQTYNAYTLSKLYADKSTDFEVTNLQNDLMKQATSDEWFIKVSSESMGVVFRQMLMYNSQMYVMLFRLWDTEKQILTAQTMLNTLIILINMQNEDMLLKRATGEIK